MPQPIRILEFAMKADVEAALQSSPEALDDPAGRAPGLAFVDEIRGAGASGAREPVREAAEARACLHPKTLVSTQFECRVDGVIEKVGAARQRQTCHDCLRESVSFTLTALVD